jgi:hypothetical protein
MQKDYKKIELYFSKYTLKKGLKLDKSGGRDVSRGKQA